MRILAIDPGTFESAYVWMDDETPLDFAKRSNLDVESRMGELFENNLVDALVIEQITSYGKRVGAEVFQTCQQIGRFGLLGELSDTPTYYVSRRDVKKALIGNSRATDKQIRYYLIDYYAPGTSNLGKGSKEAPGFFHGFKSDIWQAYACGLAWYRMNKAFTQLVA